MNIPVLAEDIAQAIVFAKAKDAKNNTTIGCVPHRSKEDLFDSLYRGKLAEVVLARICNGEVDLEVYDKMVADTGDIKINGATVEVKASKMGARWLMIEDWRHDQWVSGETVRPEYLCLLSVHFEGNSHYRPIVKYICGLSWKKFESIKDFELGPDTKGRTGMKLMSDNYIVINTDAFPIEDFYRFVGMQYWTFTA